MKAAFEKEAEKLCEAIKELSARPEALENLEIYLSYHFKTWLERYADTPENIVSEFCNFANIFIAEE